MAHFPVRVLLGLLIAPLCLTLDEVPETEATRKDRLRERWTSPMSDAAREGLGQWYGDGAVREAQYAESFQIAECGRQPTEAEIRRLFPVLAGE
jgi:hypothetical protein